LRYTGKVKEHAMLTEKRELFPNKDTKYDKHIHRDVYYAIKDIEGVFTTQDAFEVTRNKRMFHLTRDNVRRAVANICGIYGLGLTRVGRGRYEWKKS
jgi:hypothetical protein